MTIRPDTIARRVSANIRYHRLRRKLSQSELARRIGVSFQQVQKYEQAANRVPACRLFLIALALDTAVDLFFNDPTAAETG